jgi:hypothetical protein
MRATSAQVGGELAGVEPGIGGDHRPGQQAPLIQRGGQRPRGGDLATLTGLRRAGQLPEGDAAGLVERGDQVAAAAAAGRGGDLLGRGARRRSAQRLAVDGDHPPAGVDRRQHLAGGCWCAIVITGHYLRGMDDQVATGWVNSRLAALRLVVGMAEACTREIV